jgi:GNAT superfamily N-acetyltransferase
MHTEFAFSIEAAQTLIPEIEPLVQENWESVARDYPMSRLNPNFGFYVALQESGQLRVFTSRQDGVLVGYALVYIIAHPHRADDLVATIETIFIKKHARSSGHAANFLAHIEDELRMMGAVMLSLGSRNERYDRWIRMRGYHLAERVWERSLQWKH